MHCVIRAALVLLKVNGMPGPALAGGMFAAGLVALESRPVVFGTVAGTEVIGTVPGGSSFC